MAVVVTEAGQPLPGHSVRGRMLAAAFEGLGGAFLKAGQLLSTRPDLLSERDRAPLRRLCDDLRAPPPVRTAAALRCALAPAQRELLATVDPRPLAVASVTQVHRARTTAGNDVALKVLRPDAVRRFRRDIEILRGTCRVAARVPQLAAVPVIAAGEAMATALLDQLDLSVEAAHHALFAALFANTPGLRIPRLCLELSGPRVLAADLVVGARRLDDPTLPAGVRGRALRTALRALYAMTFDHGLVHCDLHPGNLLVDDDGGLVLLDFGYVAHLAEPQRQAYGDLFLAIALGDPDGAARVIVDTAVHVPPDVNAAVLVPALSHVLAGASGATVRGFTVARFVTALFRLQHRYGIRAAPGFTMAILAMTSFEGLLKQFAPDLDFQREAVPYVLAATDAAPDRAPSCCAAGRC